MFTNNLNSIKSRNLVAFTVCLPAKDPIFHQTLSSKLPVYLLRSTSLLIACHIISYIAEVRFQGPYLEINNPSIGRYSVSVQLESAAKILTSY